jgi:polyphosphate kinase
VSGVSESIRVISIVGRFLEHARVYYFGHAGADDSECIYTGSADLMRRNIDFRVEVLFPIEDPRLRKYLRDGILKVQLRDNVRARELRTDGSYVRLRPKDGEPAVDSQSLHEADERSAALRAMVSEMREA